MRAATALLTILSASACSTTLPVTGSLDDGPETFTGSATGYMDGGGTLAITTNKGLSCTGTFVYMTSRSGQGAINCTNGQNGIFEFVSTGKRGAGIGNIGSRPVTFTFG
ncbi:hypothetical protein [Reyranella sp.]|uniref:hypothetical protein n=1 Tax=Reyranella sp. TaxID=1929291 RepID=UPI003C79D6FE